MNIHDRVSILLDQAVACRKRGALDRAIARFGEAIALEPERGDYDFWRAEVWMLKGDWEQALLDLSSAIAKVPDFRSAHFARGVIYFRMGDMVRAMNDFRAAPGQRFYAWELESRDGLIGLEKIYMEALATHPE
jgi:tetratricopeptide (TPR) repeat protein